MELNITRLVNVDLMNYSASIAEIGDDAGKVTWNNALESEIILVFTPEQIAEAKDYFRDFGAWEDEEIDGWSAQETNALVLQFVAGDLREYLEAKAGDDFEQWNENHGGRIFETEDGQYWYYLGN
jgi:hypothetical protein